MKLEFVLVLSGHLQKIGNTTLSPMERLVATRLGLTTSTEG